MKLITVKLQGKEVQADLLNPKVTKRFEDGFDEVLEKFKASTGDESISGSEGIRMQCQAVIDYVTDIFGEDGAKEVFGDKTDLLTCLDVLKEMQELYPSQVNPLVREKSNALKRKLSGKPEAGEA
ncbi:hypothetical protein FND36_02955 [Lachnospiraceae bacterium KGMB03038]|nr:hypothetical protein FND36_02955 [Lachnospiraceae bacterium KGMB03038]